MKRTRIWVLLFAAGACAAAAAQSPSSEGTARDKEATEGSVKRSAAKGDAQSVIETWPVLTKTGAQAMIEKYGQPDGVTDRMLVWHDKAPWKKVAVFRDQVRHDSPIPHTDFLEHVISYQVPEDKVASLSKFDHSLVVDLTRGTLASHCDSEKANILALNLANEIVSGKRTVASAQSFLRDTMMKETSGKSSPYTEKLMFGPGSEGVSAERPSESSGIETTPEESGAREGSSSD